MMRYLPLGLIGLSTFAMAGTEPAELATLRSVYQTQVDKTREQYAQKLEALLKAESAKGNLDGAVAVREELARVKADGSATPSGGGAASAAGTIAMEKSPFYGSSWTQDQTVLEFHKDGTWMHDYKGSVMSGKWSTTGDARLITLANWNNKPDMMFILSKDGNSCLRSADGYSYKRQQGAAAATTTPAKPAPPAPPRESGANPFGMTR